MKSVGYLIIILWLLFAGFWALLLDFNQYAWSEQPMIDCDTDGEAIVGLLIWLVWLTTALLIAGILLVRNAPAFNLPTLTLGLAVALSLALMSRYADLTAYGAQRDAACRAAAEPRPPFNSPLNTKNSKLG